MYIEFRAANESIYLKDLGGEGLRKRMSKGIIEVAIKAVSSNVIIQRIRRDIIFHKKNSCEEQILKFVFNLYHSCGFCEDYFLRLQTLNMIKC